MRSRFQHRHPPVCNPVERRRGGSGVAGLHQDDATDISTTRRRESRGCRTASRTRRGTGRWASGRRTTRSTTTWTRW